MSNSRYDMRRTIIVFMMRIASQLASELGAPEISKLDNMN